MINANGSLPPPPLALSDVAQVNPYDGLPSPSQRHAAVYPAWSDVCGSSSPLHGDEDSRLPFQPRERPHTAATDQEVRRTSEKCNYRTGVSGYGPHLSRRGRLAMAFHKRLCPVFQLAVPNFADSPGMILKRFAFHDWRSETNVDEQIFRERWRWRLARGRAGWLGSQ
jgi:hypothetical protein